MLLKSRSYTHHPHMHYSYTRGRRKNMPFHLDPPKNVLLLHWEWTPKNCPIGYPSNKCSNFLSLSLKSFVAEKKHVAMQKLFMKKMDKCLNYQNNGYSDARLRKRERKDEYDSPCFLAKLFPISKEIYVFKEQNRIRLATIYIHTHAHLNLIVRLNSLWI